MGGGGGGVKKWVENFFGTNKIKKEQNALIYLRLTSFSNDIQLYGYEFFFVSCAFSLNEFRADVCVFSSLFRVVVNWADRCLIFVKKFSILVWLHLIGLSHYILVFLFLSLIRLECLQWENLKTMSLQYNCFNRI